MQTRFGVTYEFNLPEINTKDMYNAINDICVMSFVQGIPLGTAKGQYFNGYALGGSQIVRAERFYGTNNGIKLYHSRNCPEVKDSNGNWKANVITEILPNKDVAIERGFLPCQLCN